MSVFDGMARDGGYRGDEARQVARMLEDQERAAQDAYDRQMEEAEREHWARVEAEHYAALEREHWRQVEEDERLAELEALAPGWMAAAEFVWGPR